MNKTAQSARERNIQAIVSFFESGATPVCGALGIELEHTIVGTHNAPVPYSGEGGVQQLLRELSAAYPETTYDSEGDLLGVARNGEAVTIEPAAQVELSAGPFRNLAAAQECFTKFENTLEQFLAPRNQKALTLGYHPTARAADLELIPKTRYQMMNAHFATIGSFGKCMMRGSASTQISIDYRDAADCLRKLRVAFALVPLLSLICDNSPAFEGAPRAHRMVRTEIWQKCDPARCGIVPGIMEPDFTLRHYAEYILDTPAILVPDENGGWYATDKTFGEIYATREMTRADVEHALSMFFTDVRLKTYIEIRPADAMPIPYVIAYAALIKGLFYSDESLAALDALFAEVIAADIEAAKNNLMEHGYKGELYGKPAAYLADTLLAVAQAGLPENDRDYLQPLQELIAARKTLADLA